MLPDVVRLIQILTKDNVLPTEKQSMILFSGLLLLVASLMFQEGPRTKAEITNFEETSRYDDCLAFIDALKKAAPGVVRADNFGTSEEGRKLPLLILADPPIGSPDEARRRGNPVVFVMANIHAGEVEGKEASLQLARRLATGDLKPLLKDLTILIAPIYNADGNEKINLTNRTAQNGPIGGVGTRENSKGLDLNRDFMKLESSEANSLISLMNTWDPHLSIDLHTTNGSYHGYHLTYSPTLNPNANAELIKFERDVLLAQVTQAVQSKHKFRIYYYGNFATQEDLNREVNASQPGQSGKTQVWRTFDHRPRFGNNYIGLRNRLTILSEAYSYLDFRNRVAVTEAFVEEILRFSAANKAALMKVVAEADKAARAGKFPPQGVEFKLKAGNAPVDILVGEIEHVKNPRSDREMTVMRADKFTPVKMIEYGTFQAARTSAMPEAYVIPASETVVIQKLTAHGLSFERLAQTKTMEVDGFEVSEVNRATRPFQGHQEVRLKGAWKTQTMTFDKGALVVKTAQPRGALVFYLLDPESDDGLVTWNFLDGVLASGKLVPVYRKH